MTATAASSTPMSPTSPSTTTAPVWWSYRSASGRHRIKALKAPLAHGEAVRDDGAGDRRDRRQARDQRLGRRSPRGLRRTRASACWPTSTPAGGSATAEAAVLDRRGGRPPSTGPMSSCAHFADPRAAGRTASLAYSRPAAVWASTRHSAASSSSSPTPARRRHHRPAASRSSSTARAAQARRPGDSARKSSRTLPRPGPARAAQPPRSKRSGSACWTTAAAGHTDLAGCGGSRPGRLDRSMGASCPRAGSRHRGSSGRGWAPPHRGRSVAGQPDRCPHRRDLGSNQASATQAVPTSPSPTSPGSRWWSRARATGSGSGSPGSSPARGCRQVPCRLQNPSARGRRPWRRSGIHVPQPRAARRLPDHAHGRHPRLPAHDGVGADRRPHRGGRSRRGGQAPDRRVGPGPQDRVDRRPRHARHDQPRLRGERGQRPGAVRLGRLRAACPACG